MEFQKTARAIIEIEKNTKKYIVSIKRTKYKNDKVDRVYYTFPGGHVEKNESYEETVIREIMEELKIEIDIKKELANIFNSDLNRYETFYICDYKSGTIAKGDGPEWMYPNKEKYGDYEIVYLDVNKLKEYNLLPIEIRDMLVNHYKLK